jgi:hypothetical protein
MGPAVTHTNTVNVDFGVNIFFVLFLQKVKARKFAD